MNMVSLFLIFLVMLFWGGSVILDKLSLARISQIEVLFWASVTPMLAALVLIISKGKLSISDSKGIGWATLAGLFGFLGLFFFFGLLKKYPASIVTPLVALYPIITVILAIVFFSEKLIWYHALGIVFALAGIFLLTR